jgi:hypothetical protein
MYNLIYWDQIQYNYFGKIESSRTKTGLDFIDKTWNDVPLE